LNTRDRALTPEEIGAFLRALDLVECREQTRIALRLILLTLVRKRELLRARWEHLDLTEGVWCIPTTKNGKPHDVFLSKQALELFNKLKSLSAGSEFVLPHVSRLDQPMGDSTLNELLRRMMDRGVKGLSHFTVHDLRRTASTHLHEAGFNSDVIEKALNHTIAGVRGIYNRATYTEARRVMLQQWADLVVAWSERESKVVKGRFGKVA
jgi:integrase